MPQEWVRPGVLAYCAGAGEDVSFDLALAGEGCLVRTFDPTPRAIEYVREMSRDVPNLHFYPVGWWSEEDELKFYAPQEKSHVSHSILNLQKTGDFFIASVKPVHQIAKECNDGRVNIIKMDIEGAEYAVIRSLTEFGPLPDVLCVEFDQPQPALRTLKAIHRLRVSGYVLNKMEGWNFTFSLSRTTRKGSQIHANLQDQRPSSPDTSGGQLW